MISKPKVFVVADDLSGATDVGVQFASRGVSSIVRWHTGSGCRPEFVNDFARHQVVLFDAQSRHLPPGEAATRIREAACPALAAGASILYKKTDSTLRGNVGAELGALLDASGQQTLFFLPAHPAQGRTTIAGIQYVHGRELHLSEFANDPLHPMKCSRVLDILRLQTVVPVHQVGVGEVDNLLRNPPSGIVVVDSKDVTELERVAKAILSAGRSHTLAGPAGFALTLAGRLGQGKATRLRPTVPKPLLVINGSLNPVALRQCQVAVDNGFRPMRMEPAEVLPALTNRFSGSHPTAKIVADLDHGSHVLLHTVLDAKEAGQWFDKFRDHGISGAELSVILASMFGQLVRSILEHRPHTTLVVVGGDTLAGVTSACGWNGLEPLDECLPGLAMLRPFGAQLIVITKPGGFGLPSALVDLAQ